MTQKSSYFRHKNDTENRHVEGARRGRYIGVSTAGSTRRHRAAGSGPGAERV
jgi:hypothetical protein